MPEENDEVETLTPEEGKVPAEQVTPPVEAPDFAALMAAALAPLQAKLEALHPKTEEPDSPEALLEAANARVAELEAEVSTRAYRDAVRDNAEAAGLKAAAALDSDIVRQALKDVDLTDSDAVTKVLKEVGERKGLDHLRATKNARLVNKSGGTPPVTHETITPEEYAELSFAQKVKFKADYPTEFKALMG